MGIFGHFVIKSYLLGTLWTPSGSCVINVVYEYNINARGDYEQNNSPNQG